MSKTQKIIFFLPASFLVALTLAVSLAWHPIVWIKAQLKPWQGPQTILGNLLKWLGMGCLAVAAIPLLPLYFSGAFLFSTTGLMFKHETIIGFTKRKAYFKHLLFDKVMAPFASEAQSTRNPSQPTAIDTTPTASVTSKMLGTHGATDCQPTTPTEPSEKQKTLDNALLQAIKDEKVNVATKLVALGARAGARDQGGKTALHLVTHNKSFNVLLTRLIEDGADVQAVDHFNLMPLDLALLFDNHDAVQILLTHQKTPIAPPTKTTDAIKKMVEKHNGTIDRATIDPSDLARRLHSAIGHKNLDFVKYYVKLGADIELQDALGRSALHQAVSVQSVDIVTYLAGKGANIEATTCFDETPLHYAAEHGDIKMVQCLIGLRANLLAPSRLGGQTPLDFAAKMGKTETFKYLLQHVDKPVTLYHTYQPESPILAWVNAHNQSVPSATEYPH